MGILKEIDEIVKADTSMMHAFPFYGLTGQTIKVRAREDSTHYFTWGSAQIPVLVTGEYPDFMTGTVLPHINPVTGKESHPYPVTIHKHDIITLDIIPEYDIPGIGKRIDYEAGRKIGTLRELMETVQENDKAEIPGRWQMTSVMNPVATAGKGGLVVEVFPNGFIAAACGDLETVFRIENCRGGVGQYDEDYFMDIRWEVRVFIEAEDQLGIKILAARNRVEKISSIFA